MAKYELPAVSLVTDFALGWCGFGCCDRTTEETREEFLALTDKVLWGS